MIEIAREFAAAAHQGQMYGKRPYIEHLEAVAAIVEPYGETAVTVAYLHDVVEDTAVSIDEIARKFEGDVAESVDGCTDEPGKTRKERKAKTHAKLSKLTGRLPLIVKPADRLANVAACVFGGNERLLEMYRSEQPAFRQAAYRPGLCDEIWDLIEKWLGKRPFLHGEELPRSPSI